MTQKQGFQQRWADYRPTKTTWFWSMAGAAVATMIVGFTVGGWTTGGSAQEMAQNAARDARAQLASTICVEKFTASATAATLEELKDASTWEQEDFIEEGGWIKLTGIDETVPGAADLCADQLIAMESLPVRDATANPATVDG